MMGLLDVYNAQIKQRGEPGEPPTAGDAAWDAAQTGWDYISAPLRGLGYVTEQAFAGPVRSALGAIEGAPAEQKPIFFGLANVPVPTGRQLLEPLGVPPNDPSRWEVADVAGGAVDVLTDPTTYVGVGAMTKAGKLASRASALAREAEALGARAAVNEGPRAAALLAERAKIQQLLTGVEGELQALGAPNRLAPTWAEQGKLGQRTALSYPGIGGIGGERSLAAMAKVGQAVSSPFRRLYDEAFRVKGEFAGRLGVEDAARAEMQFDLSRDVERQAKRVGSEELKPLADQLKQLSKKPVDLPAVRESIAPVVQELRDRISEDYARRIAKVDDDIHAAVLMGNGDEIGKLRNRRAKLVGYMNRDLLAADPVTAYSSLKANKTGEAAAKIATFMSDVPRKIDALQVERTADWQAKINKAQSRVAELEKLADPNELVRQAATLQDLADQLPPDIAFNDSIRRRLGRFQTLSEQATRLRERMANQEPGWLQTRAGKNATKKLTKLDAQVAEFRAGLGGEPEKMLVAEQARAKLRELQQYVPGLEIPTELANQRVPLARQIAGLMTRAENGPSVALQNAIDSARSRVSNLNNRMAREIGLLSLKKNVATSTLALLPGEARDWAVRYLAAGGKVLENDIAHGVGVSEMANPFVSYVHRVGNPIARQQAIEMGVAGANHPFVQVARQMRPDKGFTIERTPFFDGLTHGQINDWWRSVGGKGDFVKEDIMESALRRMTSGAEASADAEFIRGAVQNFYVPSEMAQAGDVPVSKVLAEGRVAKIGETTLKTGKKWSEKEVAKALENTPLHGAFVPSRIANEILRTQKVLTNPVEMGRIGTFIQEAQNMVRWGFTQPFAGFHVKNRTGNWFVMALAGMRDPRWVWRARQSLTRAEKGAATAAEMASINEAIEKGALGGLQTTADIVKPGSAASKFAHFFEELGPRTGRAIGGKPGEAIGSLGRKYLQTGTRWELEDKYALYMWAKSQGKSPTEAARIVREYLFDYGELSQFEKKWLRPLAFFYCVPDDCEILTREGWKKYSQLEIGEEVLGLDAETGKSKWTPLTGVATFDYDGEMLTLGNDGKRGGYFPFTPNHRWPYVGYRGKRGVCRGYELKATMRIPRAAEMESWPESCAFTPDEAAIMGWMLTDGCFQKDGSWWMYQHPKKFIADIRRLLGSECTEHVHPDSGTVMFYIKASLRKRIQAKGFVSQKSAAAIVGTLTKECAEAMWDAMYKADGTVGKRNADFFAKQNPVVFDVAQMLVQMLGDYMGRTARGGYISRGHNRNMKVAGNLGVTHYAGKIWCPQTGTGTWLMRRNGKVVFTGNTWQRKAYPLLARNVAQNPGLGTAFNRMTGGVGDSSQSRDLQPYQINRGSFAIGDSTYFTPDLPIFTLNRYGSEGRGFGRTAQQIGGQLAPVPAAMLQMATGMDLQRGKPLSGGARGALETLLPTARLTRSLSTASDVLPADASPAEYALRTAGLSVYRTSPERRMRNRLAEISASQQRLAESGREQPSFAYSAKSQAGKDLAKERARIIAALKKVSQ